MAGTPPTSLLNPSTTTSPGGILYNRSHEEFLIVIGRRRRNVNGIFAALEIQRKLLSMVAGWRRRARSRPSARAAGAPAARFSRSTPSSLAAPSQGSASPAATQRSMCPRASTSSRRQGGAPSAWAASPTKRGVPPREPPGVAARCPAQYPDQRRGTGTGCDANDTKPIFRW